MNRRYLTAVTPLPNHVLQVDFVSGSRLLLNMKPYLDKIRFRPLADARVWNSAVTNGIFVRFGDVELSHDEILSMAEQEQYHHALAVDPPGALCLSAGVLQLPCARGGRAGGVDCSLYFSLCY